MIQVIMGLKGSGKTKKLIDSINQTAKNASGDVVCIEYDKKLTFDISYRVRLVDSKEYGIDNIDKLKGLVSGLHAGNYDITHVFIDHFFKVLGETDDERVADFLDWLEDFSVRENVKFTICATKDPDTVNDRIKKYLA
jgi:hypothetical protein